MEWWWRLEETYNDVDYIGCEDDYDDVDYIGCEDDEDDDDDDDDDGSYTGCVSSLSR